MSEKLEARAWAREAETGFGVGQQLIADTGTRAAGVDARYKLNDTFTVAGEVQHQQVLASDAKRLLASADVRMQKQGYSVGAGLRPRQCVRHGLQFPRALENVLGVQAPSLLVQPLSAKPAKPQAQQHGCEHDE